MEINHPPDCPTVRGMAFYRILNGNRRYFTIRLFFTDLTPLTPRATSPALLDTLSRIDKTAQLDFPFERLDIDLEHFQGGFVQESRLLPWS